MPRLRFRTVSSSLEVNLRASRTILSSQKHRLPCEDRRGPWRASTSTAAAGAGAGRRPYFPARNPCFVVSSGRQSILGPRWKSDREVMGTGARSRGVPKAQLASGVSSRAGESLIQRTRSGQAGAGNHATCCSSAALRSWRRGGTRGADRGCVFQPSHKVLEGRRHIGEIDKNAKDQLIVNTTEGKQAIVSHTRPRRSRAL